MKKMNRINIQIPPRAWHKKDKRYYGVSGIFWKSDKISAVMVTYSIVQTKIDISEIDLEFPIGMQIDGKEVYEGDVLTYDEEPEYAHFEIFWSDREYAFMGRDLEYENLVSLEEYDGFLCHYCNVHDTEKMNRIQEEEKA